MPSPIQLTLELANVIPIQKAANSFLSYTIQQTFDLARRLKNSGSDILVQADLTAVFGRVWIDDAVTKSFKDVIIKNSQIIASSSPSIEFHVGVGPTVDLAFTNSDRGPLATIIQLSFLGSTHERMSLASALSYGMNKRVELGIREANPSPGYDGIAGTLEAISSETATFFWSPYIHFVREKLLPNLGSATVNNSCIRLPSNLLFACLDSLCTIQRFPEDYTLTVSEPKGCITLIIWAHHLLGLSVMVRGRNPGEDIYFRQDSSMVPQVIIHANVTTWSGPEICLLGKNNEICLRIDLSLAEYVPIEARERLPLAGYSTVQLCRNFGQSMSWRETQKFEDAANFSVAIAIAMSKRLYRDADTADMPFSIKRWQLWDAAAVLFDDFKFDEEMVDKYAKNISSEDSLMDSVKNQFKKILPASLHSAQEDAQLSGIVYCEVAMDILALATVSGVSACREMPVIASHDYEARFNIFHKCLHAKGRMAMTSTDMFSHISWLLLGPDPAETSFAMEEGSKEIFMVSDFGWSLYLPTFGDGDGDPSHVNPEQLFIKRGVPTDKKTGERKSRARDATAPNIQVHGMDAASAIVENGVATYQARCVSPVYERQEFYGSRKDGFHLIIRSTGTHLEPAPREANVRSAKTFTVQQAYRSFHDNLWATYVIHRCDHPPRSRATLENPQELELSIDAATAAGNWSWHTRERASGKRRFLLPERIIIVLVSGDSRARWLAVGSAVDARKTRHTLLRGLECCETCAVQAAVNRAGKWFVIL
jgi:hypothetical protein